MAWYGIAEGTHGVGIRGLGKFAAVLRIQSVLTLTPTPHCKNGGTNAGYMNRVESSKGKKLHGGSPALSNLCPAELLTYYYQGPRSMSDYSGDQTYSFVHCRRECKFDVRL
jgi:hypothetical protein